MTRDSTRLVMAADEKSKDEAEVLNAGTCSFTRFVLPIYSSLFGVPNFACHMIEEHR